AVPQPMEKVKVSSNQGVSSPANPKIAMPAETTIIMICAVSMMLRRSKLSARAPAASEKILMGRVVAACTRATISSELEMDVISQAAPTACTSPPRLDASVAVHSARKVRCRNGARADALSGIFMVVRKGFYLKHRVDGSKDITAMSI